MIRFSSLRGSAMMAVLFAVAGQVFEERPPVYSILNLGACSLLAHTAQETPLRPSAIDGVKVEGRRARVDRVLRLRRNAQLGG